MRGVSGRTGCSDGDADAPQARALGKRAVARGPREERAAATAAGARGRPVRPRPALHHAGRRISRTGGGSRSCDGGVHALPRAPPHPAPAGRLWPRRRRDRVRVGARARLLYVRVGQRLEGDVGCRVGSRASAPPLLVVVGGLVRSVPVARRPPEHKLACGGGKEGESGTSGARQGKRNGQAAPHRSPASRRQSREAAAAALRPRCLSASGIPRASASRCDWARAGACRSRRRFQSRAAAAAAGAGR